MHIRLKGLSTQLESDGGDVMKYNKLGKTGFEVSEIGLGGEYLEGKDFPLVNDVVSAALDGGINILDCFMSNPDVRSNLGKALKSRRDKMLIQGHMRSIWKDGQYARTLDIKEVEFFFQDLLKRFQTDYIDIGMIHMIDNAEDYDAIFSGPILDYAVRLKEKGVIRSLGVSSHNPIQALRAAKSGVIDTILFSINPAYDLLSEDAERPKKLDNTFFRDKDTLSINSVRNDFYHYCASNEIGLTVMKTFAAGALLNERTSPFSEAMTPQQCMSYALSRPAVASVMIGMQSVKEVEDCLSYESMGEAEKDYSFIFSSLPRFSRNGRCVYCNHCLPCPAHIDIAQVGKYLDMALLDGKPSPTIRAHYDSLEHKADECLSCHSCEKRCPFGVKIVERMLLAKRIFS